MKGLLDTSVIIALEQGRAVADERLPAESFLSVATLAELEVGVRQAVDDRIRSRRSASLESARARHTILPINEAVASAYGYLVSTARRAGHKPEVQDACIAACAKVHGLAVYTQDADFHHLDVAVVRV
jgi:predicted nucleic acid-binding protein